MFTFTDDPEKKDSNDFKEIKGKKVTGVGLGDIFGAGPIKLRSTTGSSVKAPSQSFGSAKSANAAPEKKVRPRRNASPEVFGVLLTCTIVVSLDNRRRYGLVIVQTPPRQPQRFLVHTLQRKVLIQYDSNLMYTFVMMITCRLAIFFIFRLKMAVRAAIIV